MIESFQPTTPVQLYPCLHQALPGRDLSEGAYRVRFAQNLAELDEVLRIRFEVFNLELGEGLDASFATGRDEDEFDLTCHHLIVEERQSGRIVGTYRLQTPAMAAAGHGLYTATEYDLSTLPGEILRQSVEVGRACIAREHRGRQVLYLLWRGLALYMAHNRLRYLFGCCSLTSQDARDGHRTLAFLRGRDAVRSDVWLPALPGFSCDTYGEGDDDDLDDLEDDGDLDLDDEGDGVALPPLFQIYLRYGGKVCSPPALDRRFKTIDFLVLLDVAALTPRAHRMFFG
jgi:putative hemolysin